MRQIEGSEKAKERIKIIEFYERNGERATKEAFGADRKVISRRKKRLKDGDIKGLIPINTRPNRLRKSNIDEIIIEKIREIRQERYRISKYKLKVFIDKYCEKEGLTKISISSIGLIIKKNKMFYQRRYNLSIHRQVKRQKKVERIRYSSKVKEIVYIVSDTVVAREEGIIRYFYNAIEVVSKFAFSYYFKEQTSRNMVIFYEMFKKVFPYKIRQWQKDNGHENIGEFEKKIKEEKVRQVFSYPRCPKINAYIERFNRTLREEFIDVNGVLIKEDEEFKNLLIEWLVYYNSKRPHFSLNLKSPLQFLVEYNKMSHMYVTNTGC